MSQIILDKLFVEKYRPKDISNIILNNSDKDFFKQCLKDRTIPNLLFHGPPGSGKTSLARILTDNLIDDEHDLLVLNGSVDNGIDIVRNQITNFVKIPPYGNSEFKIVFIDESDGLTFAAQNSLRNLIEVNSDCTRFIFTANLFNKISDALKSRLQIFKFSKLPHNYIKGYCVNILKEEGIKFEITEVERIVDRYYPDVRKILNHIQQHSNATKELLTSKENENEQLLIIKYQEMIDISKGGIDKEKLNNIKSIIKDIEGIVRVDGYKLDFDYLFGAMFEMDSSILYKLIVSDHYLRLNDSMNQNMTFLSCFYNIFAKMLELNKK